MRDLGEREIRAIRAGLCLAGIGALVLALAFGAAAASSFAVFLRSRRIPWRDQREMPAPVHGSFAFLAAVLLAAGTALTLGADIFPWDLRSETSVIFGFIYLGAAAYFIHLLVRDETRLR